MDWNMLTAIGQLVGAAAVVISLLYLSRQIRSSNRLASAEASRAPNSDLNMLNASFGTDEEFRTAFRRAIQLEDRAAFDPDERVLLDFYFVSLTNLYEQLLREVRAGIISEDALDFGARGVFKLPFYRSSWPIYKRFLSESSGRYFEQRYALDPSIETVY